MADLYHYYLFRQCHERNGMYISILLIVVVNGNFTLKFITILVVNPKIKLYRSNKSIVLIMFLRDY